MDTPKSTTTHRTYQMRGYCKRSGYSRIRSVAQTFLSELSCALATTDKAVGIDMGVNERMTFSDGNTVSRRPIDYRKEKRLQRAIARKQKGSNSRSKAVVAFAREKRRNVVRNRNECHQLTSDIVRNYQAIAIEDLSIDNMTRKGGARKRGLNRSINEQTWGMLRQQLSYKAESAGRQLVAVNPAYTSKTCSRCGVVRKTPPKQYRTFECNECGFVCDRDVNAAINIKRRGNFRLDCITERSASAHSESYTELSI